MSHSQRGICSVAGDPGLKTLAATCQKSVSQIANTDTPHASTKLALRATRPDPRRTPRKNATARASSSARWRWVCKRGRRSATGGPPSAPVAALVRRRRPVPAREIFTGTWQQRRHVLAIGLEDPIPDFITFDGAMRELDRQDAVYWSRIPEPQGQFALLLEAYDDKRRAEVFAPSSCPITETVRGRSRRKPVTSRSSPRMPTFAAPSARRT